MSACLRTLTLARATAAQSQARTQARTFVTRTVPKQGGGHDHKVFSDGPFPKFATGLTTAIIYFGGWGVVIGAAKIQNRKGGFDDAM